MSTQHSQAVGIDIAHHLKRIEQDGYSIIEKAISASLIARIKSELAPYCQGQHPGRNNFEGHKSERVYALLAKAPSMAHLIEHPATLTLIDKLLPKNYLLSAALAILVHPGETPQPWHYDDGAGQLPMLKPRPRFGVSTIWALDEFTADNGATEVIPGSHQWPEDQICQDQDAVKILMPAGSVLIFDGALIHRGGANQSSMNRLAITPQYCLGGLRQIENMSLAVPPDVAARYSARIQSLLGYNVLEPGFMGYVDGVHPKKLIDTSYQGRKYNLSLPAP